MCSNPTPEPLEAPLGNGPVQFDEFTPDSFNTMYITREVKNELNYRVKYNAFFTEYASYIVGVPLFNNKCK